MKKGLSWYFHFYSSKTCECCFQHPDLSLRPLPNGKPMAPSSVVKSELPRLIRSPSANQERGLAVIWTEADETRNLCSVSLPNARIKKTRGCQCVLHNCAHIQWVGDRRWTFYQSEINRFFFFFLFGLLAFFFSLIATTRRGHIWTCVLKKKKKSFIFYYFLSAAKWK